MAELVAVQSGLALFRSGEVGVIIDTQDLNPYDPQPLQAILASGGWDRDVARTRVSNVCLELANVALEEFEPDVALTASAQDQRLVRVPKRVQDAVRSGLDVLRNDEKTRVPLVAAGMADKLLTGTVTVEQVKRIHGRFATDEYTPKAVKTLFGGDAGREWAAKVCGDYDVAPVTAAAPPPGAAPGYAEDPETETGWTDPKKPHQYVELTPTDTTCAICEHPVEDPIHVPADQAAPVEDAPVDAASTVEYFATFAPGGDEAPTFKIETLLAKDEDGSWWIREYGEWSPTQAPDDGADLVMLDPESFTVASEQLDEPGTTVAELSISEARLYEMAVPELNLDALDAVFATAPYVPPEVRSANAKKQLRDAKGQFILQGGSVKDSTGHRGIIARVDKNAGTVDVKGEDGQIKTVRANEVTNDQDGDGVPDSPAANVPATEGLDAPPANGVVKATLAEPAVVVADVPGLIAKYQELWKTEKGGAEAAPEAPVVAAIDPLIPPAEAPPASPSPTASGPSTPAPSPSPTPAPAPEAASEGGDPVAASGVTPLYLAQVDPNDVQAVLELLAIIPSTGEGDAIDVYQRDAGKWVAAPEILMAIQGPTPPPVVELNPDMLSNVLSQMDTKPAEPAPESAPAAPVAAAGYAMLQKFTLTASGTVEATYAQGARLLRPYDGELPADLIQRLDEFATPESSDVDAPAANRLKRYWEKGEGAAKIRWGTNGDWTRCVAELSEHMGVRAKGYCTLRHKGALGYYPGEKDRPGNPKSKSKFEIAPASEFGINFVPEDLAEIEPDSAHPMAGEGDECMSCGRPDEHPLHVAMAAMVGEVVSEEGDVEDEGEVDFTQPHQFIEWTQDGEEPGTCECGRPEDDPMHVVTASVGPAGDLADTATEVEAGQKFRIPLVVPEGVESGDGRTFAHEALSSRDMPLALMWQPEGDEGHKGSVIVGRIDHVERTAEGLGNAHGVFDTGEHGQEALRLVRGGMLRGISADLDEFEADVLDGGDEENKVTATKLMVNSGRLMGITLVAKPAYAECTIELVDEGESNVADGEYTQDTGEARVAALIASAAPLHPPKDWFKDPNLTKPTHLTVDDEGRVFGHIAAWDVDHIGLPFGTRAPRSASNYAYFRTGVVRTQEGSDVPVGQLTLAGGHAPLQADARMAVKHYDDTASAVADLAAGEDSYGIWVSGALRPGVSQEQVRALRASSPSGDWRPIRNKLELVAVCQVNVPGFPVARVMVASGQVTALVAAGCLALELPAAKTEELSKPDIDARIAALEAAEKRRLDAAALALRERMTPAILERQSAMTAAVLSARSRVDVVRNEKRAKLEAAKAALSARVGITAALRVMPEFEEENHPRDRAGRFREVLARLEDLLGSDKDGDAARGGVERMQDAAGMEDAGDREGAQRAAEEGAQQLEQAAKSATGTVKAHLTDAAVAVRQATAVDGEAPPIVEAGEVIWEQLTEAVKETVMEALDKAGKQVNPADVDEMYNRVKAFIQGQDSLSMEALMAWVKQQIKNPTDPQGPKGPPTGLPSAPSPAAATPELI